MKALSFREKSAGKTRHFIFEANRIFHLIANSFHSFRSQINAQSRKKRATPLMNE